MGFGQLIKYNERNIFLKNYTPRMVNLNRFNISKYVLLLLKFKSRYDL